MQVLNVRGVSIDIHIHICMLDKKKFKNKKKTTDYGDGIWGVLFHLISILSKYILLSCFVTHQNNNHNASVLIDSQKNLFIVQIKWHMSSSLYVEFKYKIMNNHKKRTSKCIYHEDNNIKTCD